MPETNTNRFIIYYPYYKEKTFRNLIWTFVYTINCFYFLCNLNNFSTVFFFIYDSKIYTTKLDPVIKKEKLFKTFLYLFSHLL